jgi:citrate lyase subunit beta/citryl-CoA lyase
MTVMRSVFYVPSTNEKMMSKAATILADVVTLDLEDSVPPARKSEGREVVRNYLKHKRGAQVSPYLYVRLNNWETRMTNDDLEAVVFPGLDGVCLAKCGSADNVRRLAWKLDELEQRRGLEKGSVAIQLLIETARGCMNAYPAALASERVNSLIFGAVDYTKDMRVELTSRGHRAALRPLSHRGGRSRRRLRGHRLPVCGLSGYGGIQAKLPAGTADGL